MQANKEITMWKVKRESDNHIQCSLIKSPVIYLEPMPRQKIEFLMEEYPHQEWLAYLVGRISEKENFFVEELSIPPHKEVSGASAEAEPFHIPENCVGIIHSHHSMGAFHSAIDQDYVDKNFPVSITVSKRTQTLEFDAISYQITPCGKGTTGKCSVKYVQPPPLFDKKEFLKEAKANIDKGKRVVYIHQPQLGAGQGHSLIPLGKEYSDYTDYVVDDEGHVLSKRELDDIMKSIYKD